MNELDELLIKVFEARFKKLESIKLQHYEEAVGLRDDEKHLEEAIFKKIYRKKVNYDWKLFETAIDEYLIKKYGFSYKSSDSLIQLKRQLKLKELLG